MASTDKAQEILEELEAGVAQIVTSDDWTRALETASRFHSYSFGNLVLIAMQRPEATRVAGFNTWKSLGRFVRKGERGIRILAPMVRKVVDDAGDEERRVVGFRSVAVFDVSQTDGAELASAPMPVLLEGEAPAGALETIVERIREAGYTFSRTVSPLQPAANGVTDFLAKTVSVRPELSPAQALKTSIHELAHVLLEHDKVADRGCRGLLEVEAESVAYIVCRTLGVDAGDYSFGYVANWSGGQAEKVLEVGKRVVAIANKIAAAFEVEEVAA